MLQLKYSKDQKSKNQLDFGYLTQSSGALKKSGRRSDNSQLGSSSALSQSQSKSRLKSEYSNSIVARNEKKIENQVMRNMSFGEGFASLSLDLDCVIHEEIKEESSNNQTNSSMANKKNMLNNKDTNHSVSQSLNF